jgi:hypothetical protein
MNIFNEKMKATIINNNWLKDVDEMMIDMIDKVG